MQIKLNIYYWDGKSKSIPYRMLFPSYGKTKDKKEHCWHHKKKIMFDLSKLFAVGNRFFTSSIADFLECMNWDVKTIPNPRLHTCDRTSDFFSYLFLRSVLLLLYFDVRTKMLNTPETAQQNFIHTHNLKSVAGFYVVNECLEMTKVNTKSIRHPEISIRLFLTYFIPVSFCY